MIIALQYNLSNVYMVLTKPVRTSASIYSVNIDIETDTLFFVHSEYKIGIIDLLFYTVHFILLFAIKSSQNVLHVVAAR